ncbi:MAG: radical SAM protein [Clostridiales bacterium]|nr:radical SAM protein [Clostridiales bacterium]
MDDLLKFNDKQLNLVVDMHGCPNRCLHCWLGHMPNKTLPDGTDEFIVDFFRPYFRRLAFYSWMREPDFCDDYRKRWLRDIAVSVNAVPERFELASFWRIARDDAYIPFLIEVGVKKVQLTLFGLNETQDRYVGRKGAFDEVMFATKKLIQGGIVPRWQCFINEENISEIEKVYALQERIKAESCPEMEFFVHEGSCDGENRKLYPIHIHKNHIPDSLVPVYLGYNELLEEKDCAEQLLECDRNPEYRLNGDVTLNIANTLDAYLNFTHLSAPWQVGNLKADSPETLCSRLQNGGIPALMLAKQVKWSELARRYGDLTSERAFSLDDYKTYLFNKFLDENFKE